MTKDLEDILKNKNLTKEQKIQAINQYYRNYRQEIDQELKKYIAKQYTGAALEIGSAAIPMNGVGAIGGNIGKEVLKKQLGRKISENIGAGALSGTMSGSLFGLGESLMNGTNPVLSSLKDASIGFATGGALGAVGSNVQKAIKGYQLKNYGNIDNLDEVLRKQYSADSRKFYQEYIQGIQLNKNGNFDFTKRGIQEQLHWNPQQAQNFPGLINDIKNAQKLPDVPNTKPMQKPYVSHYEMYRGQNGDHHIEVLKNGARRYYITKDTPTGTPHATSTDTSKGIETSLESPNGIVPAIAPNFNPQMGNSDILYGGVEMNINSNQTTGQAAPINQTTSSFSGYTNPLTGSNHIFTQEEIDRMSSEEFAKYEKEIDAQVKAMNGTMPTDNDLKQEAMNGSGVVYVNSYTRADGTKVKGYYRSR